MCQDSSTKVCGTCKLEKPLEEFSFRSLQTGRRVSDCKACVRLRSAEWYKKNKDKHDSAARTWEAKNRDRVNELKRARRQRIRDLNPKPVKPKFDTMQWRRDNKDKLNAYRKKWLQQNPAAAIADRYRRRLNGVLAGLGVRKIRTSSEFLGCTWTEFVAHIERQFLPGMTWENRGEWHIDHIIPVAVAKDEADVLRLNHYTNLRPLWAGDNFRKSGKLLHIV